MNLYKVEDGVALLANTDTPVDGVNSILALADSFQEAIHIGEYCDQGLIAMDIHIYYGETIVAAKLPMF